MLKVKCDKCKKQLNKPGALIFSPPGIENNVLKFHICLACYSRLVDWLTE